MIETKTNIQNIKLVDFRLAMQAQGGKCVFFSEWNKCAQKNYMANFGEMPLGDITKDVTKSFIPQKFDVLCAGFPCKPFSIAVVSKKKSLGRETGFKNKTQSTLFFDVADIITQHRERIMIVGFNCEAFCTKQLIA